MFLFGVKRFRALGGTIGTDADFLHLVFGGLQQFGAMLLQGFPALVNLDAFLQRNVSTLKIAKMDATRNEVEGMQIMGFPTVALFPAGSAPKQPVMYHGNRQPEDMIRHITPASF